MRGQNAPFSRRPRASLSAAVRAAWGHSELRKGAGTARPRVLLATRPCRGERAVPAPFYAFPELALDWPKWSKRLLPIVVATPPQEATLDRSVRWLASFRAWRIFK